MTQQEKQKLLAQIAVLLDSIPVEDEPYHIEPPNTADKPQLLTIKECAAEISGLSEHTMRILVVQNKIPHIRSGIGKRGKILVNKADLYKYFET